MSDGVRILTIPRHNPINAFTMGGIVRDAALGGLRPLIPTFKRAHSVTEVEADLMQRFEEWLERETEVTDLSHKATLLQLLSSYEALVDMRDTMTTSTGL